MQKGKRKGLLADELRKGLVKDRAARDLSKKGKKLDVERGEGGATCTRKYWWENRGKGGVEISA